MEKLKACPFCGCDKVKMFYGERQNYHVECYGCGKTVSFHIAKDSSWKKAIENYNRRAEPENKALTLEQLQQMDGNPAYVKNIVHPDCTGWKVCGGSFDGYFYFSNGETYELSHYGKTWLAYARKPEGSAP